MKKHLPEIAGALAFLTTLLLMTLMFVEVC